MALRTYANAPATTLASPCTNVQTTIAVASTTGLPITYPFILIVDRGTGSEEVVLCTNASGNTLTVTRGYDSTTAFAHALGATVVHGISAIDAREANAHVNASSGVHGRTGAVVGTTDTQTLTNKTLSVDSNTINGLPASNFVISDATGKVDGVNGKNIPTGSVVGTTDTQTLVNKTISRDSNTINGLPANSFVYTDGTGELGDSGVKAIPTGTVVGTTDAQALTNKTLTDSTNVFPNLGLLAVVRYTANGSFTKASYPFGKGVRVRVVAGGGGGGGADATAAGEASVGGGGGAGGYAERYLAFSSLGASETVTVGANGSGGLGGLIDGTAGGNSSFGAHASATGGAGGTTGSAGSGTANAAGGAGGTATASGGVAAAGAGGGVGFRPSGAAGAAFSGAGAPSVFGAGGASLAAAGTGGNAGGYGAGGSGAKNGASTGNALGGTGGAGVVIVEVYG